MGDAVRRIQRKTVKCWMCEQTIDLAVIDSPHPEAPTLFQPLHPESAAPWFGLVSDGTVVNVCSEACAQKMLEE